LLAIWQQVTLYLFASHAIDCSCLHHYTPPPAVRGFLSQLDAAKQSS